MHFKLMMTVLVFFALGVDAAQIDQDEMLARAQAVYEKSIKMQGEEPKYIGPNKYEGQFDSKIARIRNQGNDIVSNYLHEKSGELNEFASQRDSNLFVLVSFSMPDAMVKQYINEAMKYDASVVVIGLVDNDFLQTQIKIREIMGDSKKGGVQIDPNVFISYGVQSVPAIILTTDDYPCQASDCKGEKFDIMYGVVPIKYALESFEAGGDLQEIAASKLGAKS